MKFWLKTPNNIYKNWLNSQIDRIMFTVSKLEISFGTIQLEHPVIEFLLYRSGLLVVSEELGNKQTNTHTH